jgi:hypothetical protein
MVLLLAMRRQAEFRWNGLRRCATERNFCILPVALLTSDSGKVFGSAFPSTSIDIHAFGSISKRLCGE